METPEQSVDERHADMVRALLKPGAEIVPTITPEKAELLHIAIGMAGEVAELIDTSDPEGRVEELGDFSFFYRAGCDRAQVKCFDTANLFPSSVRVSQHSSALLALAMAVGGYLDAIKRHVFYCKPIDADAVTSALRAIGVALHVTRVSMGVTRGECLTANVEKLSVRYATGRYSDQQAQTRADKACEAPTT